LRGTQGTDRLIGTARSDTLLGYGGADYLESRRGDDFLDGGTGSDTIFGGSGSDRLSAAFDGSADRVTCGLGRDLAVADLSDNVAADCELVTRQLSQDPFRGLGAQDGTEVEPDSFAHGKVVVAAFQVGRFENGGALATGFATSKNAGKTWHSGLLPSLSLASRPAGVAELVSDPAVAYDAVHRLWLIASLAQLPEGDAVLISRSSDGITWRPPVTGVKTPPEQVDKGWLACDNWSRSPFRGRCYLTYLNLETGGIAIRSTNDGGASWSRSVTAAPGGLTTELVNGAQPLPRPDGSLVVAYTSIAAMAAFEQDEIAAVLSTDGGATFTPPRRVAILNGWEVREVRTPQFVSGDVDAGGTVYLAWQGCELDRGCEANEIVLSRSADGISWSRSARLPTTDAFLDVDSFVPGLAVAPGTQGVHARLAVAYYTLTACSGIASCERIDAGLVSSNNGGRTWSAPRRLNTESMHLSWLADTNLGRMLGDYISTSFAGGVAVPVFALAAVPAGGRFNEAIFATRVAP